jgi:hypothetical protein
MKYPIIFWVHSPIGFEAYLSFKSQEKTLGLDVKLILTRHITDENAIVQTNDKGLVWDQTEASQENTWKKISVEIEKIIEEHQGYTLCVPQSGIPYIGALIESPYCQGYTYYEDGDLNYDTSVKFAHKILQICYRYVLKIGPEARKMLSVLDVSPESISARHLVGLKLLDFDHEKYLGNFSFFDEAFPGLHSTKLPITNLQERSAIDRTGIIIVPAFQLLKSNLSLQCYKTSLRNIIRFRPDIDWVVKLHPNQTSKEEDAFADALSIQSFNKLSALNGYLSNRETAFLDFNTYITPANSTFNYLKLRKNNDFIILDYPKI